MFLKLNWLKFNNIVYFANKGPSSQGYGFSSGHVWMWELDCEKSWAPKNWCFWTVVFEKALESPLDCKEIHPAHSEEDQPWDFFGRNDAKAEAPVLWPPHVKCWLIGKDSDVGRDWRQEEKGTTEDEMAGWHPWLDGHESEWTPGDGDGQGGLASCNSWGRKELDMTEWLDWLIDWFCCWSKLNIQKMKIMASGPITSWEIDWETMETMIDFILGGSKITADGDCSHEIKRCLLLGRKLWPT